MIYLDNGATTKICKEAAEAMEPYLNDMYGNPSGIYTLSKKSRKIIEETREKIAGVLNCKGENIIFTSGGTESDNWVLENAKQWGNHIVTSKIEHHAVLNKCSELEQKGMHVSYIGTDREGLINPYEIESYIRNDKTIKTGLISIMYANNEIGTIQEIGKIAQIAKKHNILFHTDAVQAFCHVPIDVEKLQVDMLSASAHKFYGPKEIGFLYIKEPKKMNPLVYGGSQEFGKRAGTENVAAIVGMGVAVETAKNKITKRLEKESRLRDYLINRMLREIPYVRLNGHQIKRLPGNANFTIAGIDGTSLVILMDNEGVCISAGSACSSSSDKPSHVITAIGVRDKFAYGTIRITLSYENTKEEIDYTVNKLKENILKMRKAGN